AVPVLSAATPSGPTSGKRLFAKAAPMLTESWAATMARPALTVVRLSAPCPTKADRNERTDVDPRTRRLAMRMIVMLPLLLVAACDVQKDTKNDQVTMKLDTGTLKNKADSLGNAAERTASDVGNAAENASESLENQVHDLHVKV